MKTKKVIAIIEASSTGFGIYVQDDTLPLTSYGDTIEEAKADLQSVLKDMVDAYKESKEALPPAYNQGNIAFVYKYDIASIFRHFGMLDISGFAKKVGLNPSLLRQYKGGHAIAGPNQKKKIEEGLHAIGRELLSVKL